MTRRHWKRRLLDAFGMDYRSRGELIAAARLTPVEVAAADREHKLPGRPAAMHFAPGARDTKDAARMPALCGSRSPARPEPCVECGPHGGAGRVLLLDTWVPCTLCGEEGTR